MKNFDDKISWGSARTAFKITAAFVVFSIIGYIISLFNEPTLPVALISLLIIFVLILVCLYLVKLGYVYGYKFEKGKIIKINIFGKEKIFGFDSVTLKQTKNEYEIKDLKGNTLFAISYLMDNCELVLKYYKIYLREKNEISESSEEKTIIKCNKYTFGFGLTFSLMGLVGGILSVLCIIGADGIYEKIISVGMLVFFTVMSLCGVNGLLHYYRWQFEISGKGVSVRNVFGKYEEYGFGEVSFKRNGNAILIFRNGKKVKTISIKYLDDENVGLVIGGNLRNFKNK